MSSGRTIHMRRMEARLAAVAPTLKAADAVAGLLRALPEDKLSADLDRAVKAYEKARRKVTADLAPAPERRS